MVDYRINLEKITELQKEQIIKSLEECKRLNTSHQTIIFLMDLMNEMYGKEIYTIDNLSCRDCLNNIVNFWKIASAKWTV